MPRSGILSVVGGDFTDVDLIGHGDHATVYYGTDRQGRQVAIKVFDQRLERDVVFVANFRREAQRARALRHPRVVETIAYRYTGDRHCLITEYVDGGNFGRLLPSREEPVTLADWRALLDACAGLDFLHGQGIVHRNVKPTNILLRSTGEGVIGDLGPAHQPGASELTMTSTATTSVSYMSPEQILGTDLTPASDVYSMGVVLYQFATGRLPFDAPSPVGVAMQKLDEQPIPLDTNSRLPPALEAIVLRCLERDPRDRYATAGELAAEITAHRALLLETTTVLAGLSDGRKGVRRSGPRAAMQRLGGFGRLLRPPKRSSLIGGSVRTRKRSHP